jgi:hypothetical protein
MWVNSRWARRADGWLGLGGSVALMGSNGPWVRKEEAGLMGRIENLFYFSNIFIVYKFN